MNTLRTDSDLFWQRGWKACSGRLLGGSDRASLRNRVPFDKSALSRGSRLARVRMLLGFSSDNGRGQ